MAHRLSDETKSETASVSQTRPEAPRMLQKQKRGQVRKQPPWPAKLFHPTGAVRVSRFGAGVGKGVCSFALKETCSTKSSLE